jgi:CBS domain containing-hemolysin-like protein
MVLIFGESTPKSYAVENTEMEDMTEEVVGDEHHPSEFVDHDTVFVDGAVNIEEVNEALDIVLPEGEEFETIAGFIFNRAGRLVEPAEE